MIFPKNLNNFNNQLKAEEYKKFISKLIELKFIHIPEECNKCHGDNIHIQNLNNSLNTKICFRCMNKDCKNIMSIRRNSFFERHPKVPLKYLFDIIKCFTLYNFNAEETLNYIYDENKKLLMKDTILNIFSELRQEIRKYYYVKYMTEPFVEEGNMNFTDFSIISVDEAIFAIEKVKEKEENKYIKEDIKEEKEQEQAQKEAAEKNKEENEEDEEDEKDDENGRKKDDKKDDKKSNASESESEDAEKKELNKREKKALKYAEKRLEHSSDSEQEKNEKLKNYEQENILRMEKEHKYGDEYDENYEQFDEIDENLKERIKRKELRNKYKIGADGKIRPNYRLRPFWVLGMINTVTQDFRVMLIPDRSMLTLKTYLTHFIKEYNEIITDGYRGYSFLDADILKLKIDILLDSFRKKRPTKDEIIELTQLKETLSNLKNYYCYTGRKYLHRSYNHSKFEFGRGIESSSHIEGLWGNLKSLIKGIYHQIPIANLNLFLKEAEWKFKMRGFSYKQKLEFLAKIINFNLPSFESRKKDLSREKEEELSKELIKTEQPKPISKRIYNLLSKYRIFKYKLNKDKKFNESKFLLKGNNERLGSILGKQNEVTLERKGEIHKKIMEERKQKNRNLPLRAHLKNQRNMLNERLDQNEIDEEESEIEDEQIQNRREKLIKKIDKNLKDFGGNKFIDDIFKKEEKNKKNEQNKNQNQRNANPLHIQARNNLLEQKRKREEEQKKREEVKKKKEEKKDKRVLHRKAPKQNDGNYDLKEMFNKKANN